MVAAAALIFVLVALTDVLKYLPVAILGAILASTAVDLFDIHELRRLWRVDVKFVGTETVGSALGNRRAIKFDGQAYRARPNFELEANRPARTFTVWLSDDGDRVPLKVLAHTELGDVSVDLTDYTR